MTSASTICSGTIRISSRRVFRQASLKLTSPTIRSKCSSVKPPPSAITARMSAWIIGMRMRSARNATAGRRSANGRSRSARARILPPPRSLHLARAARRPVGAPALRVRIGDRLLDDGALLVQHGLDRLVLHDDPHERVRDRGVELSALRAEPDRQRNDLGVLRVRLLGDRVRLELEPLVEIVGQLHVDDREEAVLAQRDELGLGLEKMVDERLTAGTVGRRLASDDGG